MNSFFDDLFSQVVGTKDEGESSRKWLRDRGFDLSKLESTTSRSRLTPMLEASMHGETRVCHYLHSHGSGVREADRFGNSPLMLASAGGHLGTVKWLCDMGASEEVQRTDASGETPLLWACRNGHVAVAVYLIFNCGALSAGLRRWDMSFFPFGRNATSSPSAVRATTL
jgi:ankyrin repeat protein